MRTTISTILLLVAATARAAVVAAPGFAVHTITTPGTSQGGVVRRGDAILVGQGDFGAGLQSVIRLDAGGAATIATGFNSLGGFDLDAAGTLYVVDNCLECAGATTGDTVYAIADALTRTTAVTAAGHELVAAGTIPAAFDVLALPDGSVVVSDAAGNGVGRVLRVASGTATVLIPGLDLAGGIALAGDGTLRVVDAFLNPDFSTTGSVGEYAADGTARGTLVSGLVGGAGAAVDGDGNVLVAGVGAFGANQLVAVAPDGTVTTRASGFGFATDVFWDGAREEALVLDFGLTGIIAVCRDTDGDGVCDADEACVPTAIGKAKLAIGKLATPPGDDTLAFKGEIALAGGSTLDPLASGARVLIDDGADTILDAVIPGGALDPATGTGWTVKKGTFKYRSGTGGIGGIQKIALKPSKQVPGVVGFTVAGKHGSYPVAPDVLTLHAGLVLDEAAGQCATADFPGAPAPACVYKAKTGKVLCQ